MRTFILCLMALPLLAACGPRVSYELKPPQTEEGRACAGQCLNGLEACESACQKEQQSCEMLTWASRTLSQPRIFDNECSADLCISRCTEKHRICHSNCGGEVIRHTSY